MFIFLPKPFVNVAYGNSVSSFSPDIENSPYCNNFLESKNDELYFRSETPRSIQYPLYP